MSAYHKRHKQTPKAAARQGGPGRAAVGKSETRRVADPVPTIPPSPRLSLTPLAPLVIRSGRPYDSQPDPARLPPPSTVAGCLRTAWADAQGRAYGPDLAELAVTGPLLARDDTLLLPKPADALYLNTDAGPALTRAAPRGFDDGCGADLPAGLLPVRLTRELKGKPAPGPAYWTWADWLAFRQGREPSHAQLQEAGWSPPPGELRTHVAIDPGRLAASEGQLFQTQGLDLGEGQPARKPEGAAPAGADLFSVKGVRLLAEFAAPLGATLVHLGGERRLAALTPHAGVWPTPPSGWWAAIQQAGGLSLTLVTPGLFGAGYRPAWLDADLVGTPPACPGVRLRLRAAAVERWQPHSGWDLATQQPRATRKLIPAGAVYWCELLDANPEALPALWLTSLADDPQDRRDGFGLALPAAWQPIHAR